MEFALVVPILLALLLGTIEFGRAYNTQISLTHAARETARSMAVQKNWTTAVQAGRTAAPSLDPAAMAFAAGITGCPVAVTITYPLDTITGIAEDMVLQGKASMR
ncbi:pilus assembly protein, partial [Corynebacterium diphtheriae]